MGPCEEFPYLDGLAKDAPRVRSKIIRDSTMTTGAAWKSDDAGPNRIPRWVMQKSEEELKAFGVDMSALKPGVQAKLRDKAASYDDCMDAARYLTWLAYGMNGAPKPDAQTRQYLEAQFGPIGAGETTCLVCRTPLEFGSFEHAQRGKALIETAHSEPRRHNSNNVGFAHRECNIAQGDKSLGEFYGWIGGIVDRVGSNIAKVNPQPIKVQPQNPPASVARRADDPASEAPL
jgi:hypothetical protein